MKPASRRPEALGRRAARAELRLDDDRRGEPRELPRRPARIRDVDGLDPGEAGLVQRDALEVLAPDRARRLRRGVAEAEAAREVGRADELVVGEGGDAVEATRPQLLDDRGGARVRRDADDVPERGRRGGDELRHPIAVVGDDERQVPAVGEWAKLGHSDRAGPMRNGDVQSRQFHLQ
jgi:hypothetical protein